MSSREYCVRLESAWRAVLDLRAGPGGDAYGLGDLRCVAGVIPQEAIAGRGGAVRALRIRVATDEVRLRETIACDAVLMSVGFAPAAVLLAQAGVTWQFDAALQQHLPAKLPPGIFAAGRVNGVYDYAARRQDGRDAGAEAAAHARGGHEGARALQTRRATPPGLASLSRVCASARPGLRGPR